MSRGTDPWDTKPNIWRTHHSFCAFAATSEPAEWKPESPSFWKRLGLENDRLCHCSFWLCYAQLSFPKIFNWLVRCPQDPSGDREQIANCQESTSYKPRFQTCHHQMQSGAQTVRKRPTNLGTLLCHQTKILSTVYFTNEATVHWTLSLCTAHINKLPFRMRWLMNEWVSVFTQPLNKICSMEQI